MYGIDQVCYRVGVADPLRTLVVDDALIRESARLDRAVEPESDEGDAACEADKCLLLFGVLRDCSYKVRTQAAKALENHKSVKGLKE